MTSIIIDDELEILLVTDISEIVTEDAMDLNNPLAIEKFFPNYNSATREGPIN